MASYKVEITNSTQKEIRKLDLLETTPFISGYKKLTARSGYRTRVGDYRIIYDVIEKEKLIVVSSFTELNKQEALGLKKTLIYC